ncbi:MAG: signal recognition particle receptor subunit beta [Planctomycetota bacterium]|jgi:signal recognition particle receptor subunit beta
MVQINFAQKTVSVKIVYYGPGMSGKTTNLEVVHQRSPDSNRGDLTSIATDGDRTLFFDFMPLDLGTVAGMRTQFQIYTVPGQVYYNSTRKLVLQGVDGVIFIADSSASMMQENLDSLRNLEENLAEYGKSLGEVPYVIQYNKRDLPDALTVEELQQNLNPHGVPTFEGVANTGQGVFPTLKALAAIVLESIHKKQGGATAPTARAVGSAPPTAMAPPVQLASTGFYQPASTGHAPSPPSPQPFAPQAPMAAPPAPAMPQHLAAAASAGASPQAGQPAAPIAGAFPQPGSGPNGVDELSKTKVHAPPMPQGQSHLRLQSTPIPEVQAQQGYQQQQPMQQQPMQQQPMQQQPMQQQPMQPTAQMQTPQASAGYAPQQVQPPALQPHQMPAQGMPPQQMQQSGMQAAPYATATEVASMPHQQHAASSAPLMQLQGSTAAPPPPSASGTAMPPRSAQAGGRLKPRATPGGSTQKKTVMTTGAFVALALAAGVVIGSYVFRLF